MVKLTGKGGTGGSKMVKDVRKRRELCSAVFGNSLIVSEIFKYISTVEDLKKIRLACRLWKDVTLAKWRGTATFRLLWRDFAPTVCNCFRHTASKKIDHSQDTMSLSDFLQLSVYSEVLGDDCPHQLAKWNFNRFRLVNCSLHDPAIDEDLQLFWEEFGSDMKYLNLDHCMVHFQEGFKMLRGIFMEKVPNLEELAMVIIPIEQEPEEPNSDDEDEDDQDDEEDDDELEDLEKGNDKMESLSLEICLKTDLETVWKAGAGLAKFLPIFPNVKNLKADPRNYNILPQLRMPTVSGGDPIKLRSLTFTPTATLHSEHYRLLTKYMKVAEPQLEVLKIPISGVNTESSGTFRRFLKCCQSSLTELELQLFPKGAHGQSLSSLLKGLNLPQLTKLSLVEEPVIDFKALRGLPNLKRFWVPFSAEEGGEGKWNMTLTNCEVDGSGKMGEEEAPWRELEQLHMGNYKLDEDNLRLLGRWMPNLKTIHLHLPNIDMEIVKDIWPGLDEIIDLSGDNSRELN